MPSAATAASPNAGKETGGAAKLGSVLAEGDAPEGAPPLAVEPGQAIAGADGESRQPGAKAAKTLAALAKGELPKEIAKVEQPFRLDDVADGMRGTALGPGDTVAVRLCVRERDGRVRIGGGVRLLRQAEVERAKGVVITVRDGFGFLRCEERDEKDQLFFHFRELPDNMHPAPGDEFDFVIGTEAAGGQQPGRQSAQKGVTPAQQEKAREQAERLRSIPTGTVKFEDEVAAELTGTVVEANSGGGGFVEAVWEGETVRARFQVRDIAEPKGCREGPATGSTLTFALWRARGPKKTLLARTLKLAVMAGTVDAIKGDPYSKSSFGFIRSDVKFGGAGAGGGTGAAAKDAEAKAAAAKANEGRPIVDDAADGEAAAAADGAAADGEGEAAAPAAAAPTKLEEMQAAAEAEKEKEKGQPTIFYHSQDFKEAGGASLNVGDEVEFYAFVDKVKGEAVARKLKRTKEAEVKAAPRGEWKKRDERAHSKFAKGPDGTKGFAEGSRPLAAAASLVAALAIAG